MDLSAYEAFDAGDPDRARELLAKFNLTAVSFGQRNKIFIEEGAQPMSAIITFRGDDNEVVIASGGTFRGELVFIESRSRVIIHRSVRADILVVTLYMNARFEIGAGSACYGLRAWVSDDESIELGEDCLVSEGVTIRTSDHHSIFDLDSLEYLNVPQTTIIEPYVWLGQDVAVLKGVRIGCGSIIGARSLVTRSVPATELWSGSPARMARQRVSWHSSLPAHPFQLRERSAQLEVLIGKMKDPAARETSESKLKRTSLKERARAILTGTPSLKSEVTTNAQEAPVGTGPGQLVSDGASETKFVEGLIDALYRKVLLRPPEDGVVAAHAQRAVEHAIGPAEMLESIFRCEEFGNVSPQFISTYVDPRIRLSDHSQSGEATYLVKDIINQASNHRLIVDVGARGRDRSNSFDLLRCFEWKGLLIEANPNLIEQIRKDFDGLDFTLVNCAVADYEGEADFFFGINDDVSSLRRESSAGWGELRGRCKVLVRRLSGLLQDASVPLDFDILSLDIEGYDVAVLNDLVSTSLYRPRRIVIEMHEPSRIESLEAAGFHPLVVDEYVSSGSVGANLFLTHKDGLRST